MGEITFGHEIIGFDNTLDVRPVDTYSNTHKHVLRPLSGDTVDLQQVGAFKGFETEAERRSIIKQEATRKNSYKL